MNWWELERVKAATAELARRHRQSSMCRCALDTEALSNPDEQSLIARFGCPIHARNGAWGLGRFDERV